ncbi:type II secretion system protein M [Ferrimonas aestuarii]|uniref:Type II secretion system protein M n=2 Tax=Ferrimonas aestuarii TaxID=2569539 RepID=A0A4U1BRZ8_9GAMM|nr:type II secretion system protein M [Ferrimonas aestuarii]
MMQQLRTWWQKLNDRERQLLTVAAPVAIIGGFYWLIWQPINLAVDNAERALKAEQVKLADIKRDANRYLSLKQSGGQVSASGSVSQIVTQSAKQYGLSIERMQPQGQKLQVWLTESSFDALVNWLAYLSQQGIRVEAVDLSATDTAGKVEVRRLQLVKG